MATQRGVCPACGAEAGLSYGFVEFHWRERPRTICPGTGREPRLATGGRDGSAIWIDEDEGVAWLVRVWPSENWAEGISA